MFNEIYAMQFEMLIQIKGKVSVLHCLNNSYRSWDRATVSTWPAGIMALKNILYPHQFFWAAWIYDHLFGWQNAHSEVGGAFAIRQRCQVSIGLRWEDLWNTAKDICSPGKEERSPSSVTAPLHWHHMIPCTYWHLFIVICQNNKKKMSHLWTMENG